MARRKVEEQSIIEKIYDYTLEDIMGDRFGRYAKSIIQDRALPDVRDGLKPVQRRILYTMWEDRNTSDKPYRKCAKAVGDVMGNTIHMEIQVSMVLWYTCLKTGKCVTH